MHAKRLNLPQIQEELGLESNIKADDEKSEPSSKKSEEKPP